jgi:hypothetical protein
MAETWHEDPSYHRAPGEHEHPVVGWISLVAILAAILAITWVGFEIHGARQIEAAFNESVQPAKPAAEKKPDTRREIDEAVTTSRWATGLSP